MIKQPTEKLWKFWLTHVKMIQLSQQQAPSAFLRCFLYNFKFSFNMCLPVPTYDIPVSSMFWLPYPFSLYKSIPIGIFWVTIYQLSSWTPFQSCIRPCPMALCRKLCAAGKIPRTRWAPTWSVTACASSERTKACKYISRQRMTDANALLKQVPGNIPLGQTSPSLRFSSWAVNLRQEWLSKLEACLQQLQPTTSNEDWWQSNEVGWCIMDVFCWKNCDLANRFRWCCLLESLQCSDVKCRMPRPSLMRLRHDDTGDFGKILSDVNVWLAGEKKQQVGCQLERKQRSLHSQYQPREYVTSLW